MKISQGRGRLSFPAVQDRGNEQFWGQGPAGLREEPGPRFPAPRVRLVKTSGRATSRPVGGPPNPLPLSPPGRSRAREAPGGGAGLGLSRGCGRGEAAALGLKVRGAWGPGRALRGRGVPGQAAGMGRDGAAVRDAGPPGAGVSAAEPFASAGQRTGLLASARRASQPFLLPSSGSGGVPPGMLSRAVDRI